MTDIDALDAHLVRHPRRRAVGRARPPPDRHLPARRVAPQAAPVHRAGGARHRRGARRLRHPGDRGDPRRRPRRLVVQLRVLQDAGAGADQDRGRDREARQDRVPDAARRRHQGRHPGRAGQRRPDLPDRHPLHRGRRLDPALRAGPRARPGDGRLPDDEPHPAARGAGQAGADHGRRRLPVRLRRRLGRRADHGADRRPGRPRSSPRSATSGRRRLPRPREPRPRRRQHRHRRPRRCHPDRRLGPPLRRRRRQHAARGVHRRLRQARLDDRRRLPPDRRRVRGRHQAGDARGVPARPDDADDGLRRRLLLVPQARRQRRRPLRRLRRQDPARGRPPQADRRPGGPAHRHRADAEGRAGRRGRTHEPTSRRPRTRRSIAGAAASTALHSRVDAADGAARRRRTERARRCWPRPRSASARRGPATPTGSALARRRTTAGSLGDPAGRRARPSTTWPTATSVPMQLAPGLHASAPRARSSATGSGAVGARRAASLLDRTCATSDEAAVRRCARPGEGTRSALLVR